MELMAMRKAPSNCKDLFLICVLATMYRELGTNVPCTMKRIET